MRILYIVHQFFPDKVGGTENYTLDLARGAQARGHQVAVFHRAPDQPGLTCSEWEGVSTRRACAGPMTPLNVFRATFGEPVLERAFAETLNAFQPDLIHIQHLMGLPVSLVGKAQGRPLVLTLHDFWFTCANAQLLTNYSASLCNGPRYGGMNCARCALARAGAPHLWPGAPLLAPLMAHRNRLLHRVLQQMSLIIAPSRFLERLAATWGAPVERLRFVPHGLDVSGVRPRTQRQDTLRRFVYIGGLAPQKGVHVLIQAFNDLEREATLDIYGDEARFPDYVRALKQAARSSQIRFGGRLDRAEVWRVLAEVDALAVPSLWYENAPVVIQEAFAAGVPVIASKLGALPEWVRDGVDGLCVPPGDVMAWQGALRRLVDEPGLTDQLRANIRQPVTLAEHLAQLEGLYAEAVSISRAWAV